MENDIEEKQTYLRENILNKGYNAEEFMSYLNIKKGEKGLDLGNWTMEELENTVAEFIEIKNQSQKKEEPPKTKPDKKAKNKNKDKDKGDKNKNNLLSEEERKRNQEYMEDQLNSIFEPEFIVSVLSETTPITDAGSVQIKLSSPEKVDGGIFGKSYITYLIETSPFNFRVRKRYSDFEWLRNALCSQYLGCVIPPLCKKNYGDRFTEALVAKRTRLLQKFIEGILIHPLMRNNQAFYDFISTANDEEFENKKKKYDKDLVIPVAAKDMKSFDGQVRISVSKEKETYLDNIKDNADINIKIIQQLTKNYKVLITLMQQTSEKMKEIAELWKQLYEKSQSYYEPNCTIESYNLMNKIMKTLSDIESKKRNLMNNYIREYFRFVKNEFISLKDITAKADENKVLYHKAFDTINSKKEKLFKKQDINNWQIADKNDLNYKVVLLTNKKIAFAKMIPEETKAFNEVKYNYGFYLNSVISEYERLRILNSRRHKDHVKIFAKMLMDITTQFHSGLNDQIYFFEGLRDDEDIYHESSRYDYSYY